MKQIFALVVFLFLMTSCMENIFPNSTGGLVQVSQNSTQTGNTIEQEIQPPLSQTATGVTNEQTLFLENSVTEETASMQHKVGEETRVYFINTQTGSMNVSLTFPGTKQGNLRLAQIVMPDGTMDGPFGQDTDYELTQLGGYQLLFRENMMSGDPWSGAVDITVKLSK